MLGQERNQVVDTVIDTVVRGKVGLDSREQEHGAVSSAATVNRIRGCLRSPGGKSTYTLGPWLWEMAIASSVE